MKISYNWLKQYAPIDLPVERISELLTDSGLEVEGVHEFLSVTGGLEGLVVGEVLTCEKHPDADKLKVTTVNVGADEPLQIVCGAPNVAVGLKVIVALVGCTLYPTVGEPFKIKKGKIRGQISNGMLCAEDEIGLGTGHDGITELDAQAIPGTPLAEYFNIEKDHTIEIGLTPNRAEAASHIGTARDLVALSVVTPDLSVPEIQWPDVSQFQVNTQHLPIEVDILNAQDCIRYTSVSMTGVQVAESPDWLKNRLKAIGLSPINNIVDISNFVLHEVGQPLHIFDAAKIEGGKVIVTNADKGAKFTTLDEVERTLDERDLMICNAHAPMCIAGVFGGLTSGVTNETVDIFIESANFHPVSIRKTAKRHGLNTDASFRFERGVDPALTMYALKRAALLIQEIAGGQVSSEINDFYPTPVSPYEVEYRISYGNKIIGKALAKSDIVAILKGLDITITEDLGDTLKLSVPYYRVDVQREIDVIEEVLRIYGYNNVEMPKQYNASVIANDEYDHEVLQNKVSDHLTSLSFLEAKSNSLTASTYYSNSETWPLSHAIRMKNPLSQDLDVLRQTLLFDALEAVRHNQNRQTTDLKLYEFGKTYQMVDQNLEETQRFSITMVGQRYAESWSVASTPVGFQDILGYITSVVSLLNLQDAHLEMHEVTAEDYAYGVHLTINKLAVATFGRVSDKHTHAFGIKNEVFFGEFHWANLKSLAGKKRIKYVPVPKFPSMRRDLSLLLSKEVTFAGLKALALKQDRKLLKEVNLFDVYAGKNLPTDKKSYALSFVFQHPEKTLTDKVVDKTMQKIIGAFTKTFGAELR